MKKILITLLLGLLSLNLDAQHMKFNGVEMTGSLSSFVAKLKAKGWRDCYNESAANNPRITALEKSNWAGLNDVMIGVYATPKTKTTYLVIVNYICSQDEFYYCLENLKSSLTSVYGEPDVVDGDYVFYVDNNYELIGYIRLETKMEDGCLRCTYSDKKGFSLNEKEKQSDL